MNGELLRQLFKSHAIEDDAGFHSAAFEIIKQERQRNHRLLADDLERILQKGGRLEPKRPGQFERVIPTDKEKGFPLFAVGEFEFDWSRLIVPDNTLYPLIQVEREYQKRELLTAAGIGPKKRLLFYGPPGCGKTLAAKVLSSEIGYPLITVRLEAIISSFLGETAANLRKIFDFLESGRWVVLFDEFDAVGLHRQFQHDHGELRRVVNSLLQMFDAYDGESLLIAATNFETALDPAIWRRFDTILKFPVPTKRSRLAMLRSFYKGVRLEGIDFSEISGRLAGASGADVERVAVESYRLALISGSSAILKEHVLGALADFDRRKALVRRDLRYDDR